MQAIMETTMQRRFSVTDLGLLMDSLARFCNSEMKK